MKKHLLLLFSFLSLLTFSVSANNEDNIVENIQSESSIEATENKPKAPETIKEIIEEKNPWNTKVTKTELINNLIGSEDKEHLKEIEQKIKELTAKSENIEMKNKNLIELEWLLKSEIKTLSEKVNSNTILWDEYKKLQQELKSANAKLEAYEAELLNNQIQAEHIDLLVKKYKELKDEYLKKNEDENKKKITLALGLFCLWIVLIVFLRIIINALKKYFSKEVHINLDTLLNFINSFLTLVIFSYIAVILLQIFEQFLYILLLVLWSVLVILKDYLQSLFAFMGRMAFKMKLGDYVMIDSKPCKIKNISPFFTLVEIYWEDLNLKGNKNYFNNEFITKASALDIQELGVIHTLTYEIDIQQHNELLIQILDSLLNSLLIQSVWDTDRNDSLFNKSDNKFLLSYFYTINKKKTEELEFVFTLKALKGHKKEIFALIKQIDSILLYKKKQ